MMSHYHINKVTTYTPMLVEGIPLECLVTVPESDRDVGKGLVDGGADNCVVGDGNYYTRHNVLP